MPFHKSIQKARARAFQHQEGCCYYCAQPMWLRDPAEFALQHALTRRQAKSFQCTAEHLTARCDGGSDSVANIVAACLFCNTNRHKRRVPPDPVTYKDQVRRRVAEGRWRDRRVLTLNRAALANSRATRPAAAPAPGG